ncbi:cytochrome c-type biogenesis protein CcmH [Sedimentimonas flavescens]|uniref:Cytochrome c-type biogenesis protein n=1 Tax=Sedimentimonas flavescens TaxID=2851012 RepID=A0ABT3A2L6_9RHOB|nr:cytochrome c-type biogenesis protein [Sedimentimonas flavescens]MCV2880176.1 cytochrome c-type biogenesis protein CcmH [Sedimentimonas flavescens]
MLKRLALCLLLASPAFAVQPDEVLPDPAMEARARQISQVLRCPVCQGENIDESNAEVSRDLRLLVRERLVAGDTDSQVLDYITDRYGEYVLFEPEKTGANLILYYLGPVALLIAMGGAFVYLRGRRREDGPGPGLSAEEEARLKELMKDEPGK